MDSETKKGTGSVLDVLDYPFDPAAILKKKLSIKKELLNSTAPRLEKRIAVLGGSTTNEIVNILELFLLKIGIKPAFYECEYGKYYEEIMFDQAALKAFKPDLIYIHTTSRDLTAFPSIGDRPETVSDLRAGTFNRYRSLWETARDVFQCPVIQNNFELPQYRPLGSLDFSAEYGRTNFIQALNCDFADYARTHNSLIINDIFYLSSCVGLDNWYDDRFWFSYKYAMRHQYIPSLAYGVAQQIGAMFGFSKKCLVLDLDNTLWGGIIGEAGLRGIQIGKETPLGEAYTAFQQHVKELGRRGVILAVCSKNERENALEGFTHPDTVLKAEDFADFRANWEMKSANILEIAKSVNIGADSLVFIDDSPAEREIVRAQASQVVVPEAGSEPQTYMRVLDRGLFFESVALSEADLQRNQQYLENRARESAEAQFQDYDSFLKSLEMRAEIAEFEPVYLDRIAQLINKTNQFNLTTKRRTLTEVEQIGSDPSYIPLYGRLKDKFGDNGLISILIGRSEGTDLHIDTWLMSCRVLKRGMEAAMLNALVERAIARRVTRILGDYIPTSKNKMVAELLSSFGFELISKDASGRTSWVYRIPSQWSPVTHQIAIAQSTGARP